MHIFIMHKRNSVVVETNHVSFVNEEPRVRSSCGLATCCGLLHEILYCAWCILSNRGYVNDFVAYNLSSVFERSIYSRTNRP